jgi:hypothetical protein
VERIEAWLRADIGLKGTVIHERLVTEYGFNGSSYLWWGLKRWRAAFLAYFDTAGASNGGTEAMNGLIELHRRIARGFRNRNNYRLRTLLIGGGLAIRHRGPVDLGEVRGDLTGRQAPSYTTTARSRRHRSAAVAASSQ